jgi:uncharacterized protein
VTARPAPVPDEVSRPFWAATKRHVLTLARCAHCGTPSLPPEATCAGCRSSTPGYTFESVSGRGVVRSWTTVRQAFLSGFEVPYVLVDVELAGTDGLRMIGQLTDGPDAPLCAGAPVVVAFQAVGSDAAVPAFTLTGESP